MVPSANLFSLQSFELICVGLLRHFLSGYVGGGKSVLLSRINDCMLLIRV